MTLQINRKYEAVIEYCSRVIRIFMCTEATPGLLEDFRKLMEEHSGIFFFPISLGIPGYLVADSCFESSDLGVGNSYQINVAPYYDTEEIAVEIAKHLASKYSFRCKLHRIDDGDSFGEQETVLV